MSAATSTTCNNRLAFAVSSKVALKASTSVVGKSEMNPTVSANSTGPRCSISTRAKVGSRVANNLSAA